MLAEILSVRSRLAPSSHWRMLHLLQTGNCSKVRSGRAWCCPLEFAAGVLQGGLSFGQELWVLSLGTTHPLPC